MSHETPAEIVRWYTRARKFPQLVGRTPDGTKIPFGPYTVTQAVAAGVILLVAFNTTSVWARFGLLVNVTAFTCVLAGTVWLIGRIPVGSRSPVSVVLGAVQAITAPRAGRIGGRVIRVRPPHRVQHRLVVAVDLPDEPSPAPEPAAVKPALTQIQTLLAANPTPSETR
ncbi:hypothetical protein [Nocardioides limicola]|uniref:hypothetical protein n=1 Tax=Nocardioides limicola TaxID=2803368 RepID=UPI00193C59A5|nr:hypothetical protein [Nocardioides sp. DJM-14]